MAKVICQFCKVKDEKMLMQKGIIKSGYIHNTCIPEWENEQERKRIENQQWSELFEFLKELHNAIELSSFNIKRLRNLKESKNITYSLILDAYKISEDTIRWFIKNVLKDSNTSKDIDACITMMLKHGINLSYQQEQLRKKRESEKEKMLQQGMIIDMSDDNLINKKFKKDEMDISHLL